MAKSGRRLLGRYAQVPKAGIFVWWATGKSVESGGEAKLTEQATRQRLEVMGTIVEALPNAMFKVQLDTGHEILGYLCGKMRRYYIKVLLGDKVKVELSPYDLEKGRIVYRYKKH